MKTIVIANQKGGVGKTATTVHLAFDFLERGKRVAVLDLDTQGNASFTLNAFNTGMKASDLFLGDQEAFAGQDQIGNDPCIMLVQADDKLTDIEESMSLEQVKAKFKQVVQRLAQLGFDVCLVDTTSSFGKAMTAALYGSGFVLSPIELEAYSLQGLAKMFTVIKAVRRENKALHFLGMLPSKVDGRNQRHRANYQELQAVYPQYLCPVSVGLRNSIADSNAMGVPVWKIKKTAARAAAKEMRAVADYVYQAISKE